MKKREDGPRETQADLSGCVEPGSQGALRDLATLTKELARQQNEFNAILIQQTNQMDRLLQDQASFLAQRDHEQSSLVRDLAELTTRFVRLNRRLTKLEERLARWEDVVSQKQPQG